MIDVTSLRKIFNEKLAKTDSLDAAFTKAVWVAFQQGNGDITPKENLPLEDWSSYYTDIYPLTRDLHKLMALHKWKEAESVALKLKHVSEALYRACLSHNVQSGTGFTS